MLREARDEVIKLSPRAIGDARRRLGAWMMRALALAIDARRGREREREGTRGNRERTALNVTWNSTGDR